MILRYGAACLVLLLASCGGGPEERPAVTLADLQILHAGTLRHNLATSNFRATGYFSYRDDRQDLNLALVVRHDRQAGFTRISLHGNLDNDHWGEIVVHGDRARLYFPLQGRLYAGRPGSSLQRVAGVALRLGDLLRLSEGSYYLVDGARPVAGTYTAEHWILTLARDDYRQRLYYNRADSRLARMQLFEGDKEVARIAYGSWRVFDGREFATRGTLTMPSRNVTATVWFSAISGDFRFAPGDELLEVASGIEEERL